jgi:arsenite-transporting ATPase
VRLVLYTGKGGAGKTTTAAATAVCAAERGRRTLVASADAAHSLGDVLECRLGAEPTSIAPNLDAVEIDARVEVKRRWGAVRDFLVGVFRHQGIDGVVAEELALLPGVEELSTLLAVEEAAAAGEYEFLVVDCAPTDATLRLLTLPDVAHRSLRVLLPMMRVFAGVATPIAKRLVSMPLPASDVFRDVDELVYGHLAALQKRITGDDTSVRIVVTPERMVIDEARRAHTDLCLFDVPCDAVVMNRVLPDEAAGEDFFRPWCELQEERLREVTDLFAPLPVLVAPLARDEVTGLDRLAEHARAIFAEIEPDAVLARPERVRFERCGTDYLARVPLPGADSEHLDVAKIDDELTITAGNRRRSLILPRRIAPLHLVGARLEGPSLVVRFADTPAKAKAKAG